MSQGESRERAVPAAELSAQLGRVIAYENLQTDDHRAVLLAAGLPEDLAAVLVDADRGIARGDLDALTDTLESLIGRAPTTLAEAVSAALARIDA